MKSKLTIRTVKTFKPKVKPYEVYDTEIPGFLIRIQPSGVMTYYLAYRNDQNRKRRYRIGRSLTPIQARDTAQRLFGEIANGIDIYDRERQVKNKIKREKENTLAAFLNEIYSPWLMQHRNDGKSDLIVIKREFKDFMATQLKDISKWNIQRWKMDKKKQGLSDHTINRYFAELTALLNKAVEWERIEFNPLAGLSKPKTNDNKRVRYLSDLERKRLYWAMDDREQDILTNRKNGNQWRTDRGYELLDDFRGKIFIDHLKPLVILALNTGLRRGELFKLTWSNVNFSASQITIASSTSKNKKARHIPLNQEAIKTLRNWKKQQPDSDLVFPGKNGHPLNNIKRSWAGLLERANISDFRFHDTRHDFASQLVMKGVDLYVVKELLGHSTIQMTERYAHLAPKHLEHAVNLLNK